MIRPLSLLRGLVRTAAIVGLVLVLTGCGGGGGGSPAPEPTPPVPPLSAQCAANSVARLDSEALVVGQTSEVHLMGCGAGLLNNLRWTYSGASTLKLLTDRSPSLSVLPTMPGPHRFDVSFSDATGRSHSGSVELNAAPADLPRNLLTRGDPSSWAGDRLSLRAWPQGYSEADLAGSSTAWTRVSGPDVTMTDANSARLLVTAPSVASDQLLVLRATLSWPDGRRVSDDFRLLVQPVPGAAAQPLFRGDNAATRTVPYLEAGPQAAPLARCIYNPALQSSGANLCTLGELPLLGQTAPVPSVEQVMQRVLVSHDWQAEVFERFLREQDPSGDLRRMLAATTAVVIGGREIGRAHV